MKFEDGTSAKIEYRIALAMRKGIAGRLIAQGCKKDKGSKAEDYDLCTSCDFSASIFVEK